MVKKRASLKGKGADIFLGPAERGESQPRPKATSQPHQKATFYFPPEVLQDLDQVWLDLRRVNRNVKKSDVVAAAVRATLAQHAKDPKTSPLAHLLAS